MERDFSVACAVPYRADERDDRCGDCSAAYGPEKRPLYEPTGHAERGVSQLAYDDGRDRTEGEGPINAMPGDLWRLIVTYLRTSETMTLRCTGSAVQRQLKVITDAILEGCWMIDGLPQEGPAESNASSQIIDALSSLRFEARCDMLQRYARQVGMDGFDFAAHGLAGKADARTALYSHYFAKKFLASESARIASVLAWRRTVNMTKAVLLNDTKSASPSIALSQLYAAELYAPLLGIIADPHAHVRCVMDEAAATLSTLRWIEFLYAVFPLKDILAPVETAFQVLAVEFDRAYPMPRIEVLATVVGEAMKIPHRQSVREICLHRIGLTSAYVADQITPRIAESVTTWLLSDATVRAADLQWRLTMLAERWGDDDGAFASALHLSFLNAVAKNAYCESMPWSRLSEAVRITMCTRVLGIAPCESAQCGLKGTVIFDFWGLYYKLADPMLATLSAGVESKIDALPWPLQAALWRLTAETHSDPQSALTRFPGQGFHALSIERIDALCTQALQEGRPKFALAALIAALRWQVIRACESIWDDPSTVEPAHSLREMARAGKRVSFPLAAWSVFECCSLADRLPFIAALFSYRDLLQQCGYYWQYEAVVAKDMVAFMVDADSRLIRPPCDVIHALLHHLPSCGERLPEFIADPENWEAAFSRRFDLTLTDHANGVQ